MRLATIQDKRVLKTLLKNQTHISDFYYIFNDLEKDYSQIAEIYQTVMKHYGYNNPPIFACVIGKYSNFYGSKSDRDIVLLELNVPNDLVNLQADKHWLDFIYYFYRKKLFMHEDAFDQSVAEVLNGKDVTLPFETIQATIPFINPDWLQSAYEVDKDFIDKFRGVHKKLKELDTYELTKISLDKEK